jgi:dTDP-D-glucose 4,6-dehydratase
MILDRLGWEPSTKLRDGMERTYHWIYDEFLKKHDATSAVKAMTSSTG